MQNKAFSLCFFFCVLCSPWVMAQSYFIRTIAGNGVGAFSGDGGQSAAAQVKNPGGLAMDASGNLYVADVGNQVIRKISPSGIITTVAGTGTSGYNGDGIAATSAQLYNPTSVAVDPSGNLFIVDRFNHRIRKVNTSGIISTVAGNGSASYSGDGGAASAATLNYPVQVILDGSGNLYISDAMNNRIRKINTSGIISTVAGTGAAGYSGDGAAAIAAKIHFPSNMVFDQAGDLIFTDLDNNVIRSINTSGVISTIAGTGVQGFSGNGGAATAAQFYDPAGLAVDAAGNLYVTDDNNNCIRVINTSGIIDNFAGTPPTPGYAGDGGSPTSAMLSNPNSLLIDGSGNIYFSDGYNHRVRKITYCSSTVPTLTVTGNTTVCQGNSTVLTANGASTYYWSSNPAISCITNTISLNPTTTTTYSVAGFNGNCGANQTITVTVPSSTFAISGSNTVCGVGGSTTLSGTGTASSYTWSANAGGANTNTVVVNPTSNTIYTLTENIGGCISTGTINVTIAPNINISGNTTICPAGTTTLYVSGPNTYTWSTGSTGFYIIVSPSSTTVYSVSGTTGSCTNTQTVSVVVSPNPTVSISGNTSICSGTNANLLASGATSYTWQPGPNYGASVVLHPGVTTIYTVTASSSAGCYGANTVTVNVTPQPTLTVTGNTVTCSGISNTLTASGATTYSWSANAGGATTSSVVVAPAYHNYLTYTVTGANGSCVSTSTFTISIIPLPAVRVTGISSLPQPASDTLAATGASSYTWSPGGSTTASVVVTPSVTSVYTVTGFDGTCYNTAFFKATVGDLFISTYAGNGSASIYGDGGPAVMAGIGHPSGVAIDKHGNVYFSSIYSVRKIDRATGIITTFAGNGTYGHSGDGGPAASAQLLAQRCITFNKWGELFIVDGNYIRKVDTLGIITTFAGSGASIGSPGTYGLGDGGPATQAPLNQPWSIACDTLGNVYISEYGNYDIRKVNSSGIITTFAGTGALGPIRNGVPALSSRVAGFDIALDKKGNIYLCGDGVRKIDTAGIITAVADSAYASPGTTGDGGPALDAKFNYAVGLEVDKQGNIYVADEFNGVLRVIDTAGFIRCMAGNYIAGYSGDCDHAINAQMSDLQDMAIDDSGYVFVADFGTGRIRKLSAAITPAPPIIVSGATPICSGNSTSLTASGALTYTWSANAGAATTSSVTVTPSSNSTYSVTGINGGCLSTGSIAISVVPNCVWPGDADENLTVDNMDLFPIGIKFGSTGSHRTTISNNWQGYVCSDWNDTLSSGINTKYADCNGDSTINLDDTLAINLNYNLTHPARYYNPNLTQTGNPDIYIQFDKPQYVAGDTLRAAVFIGSGANVQSNFYGAAFTLNYDNSRVQSGTERFWFNNSWVGNIDQSKITFGRIDGAAGSVAASLVRITHTDTAGFGKVATLQFILKAPLSNSEMYFTFTNSVKTDHQGMLTPLSSGIDSAQVVSGGMMVGQNSNGVLQIYPNPAHDHLLVSSPSGMTEELVIYDLMGNEARRARCLAGSTSIDISSLPNGIYLLKIAGQHVRFVKE